MPDEDGVYASRVEAFAARLSVGSGLAHDSVIGI